MHPPLVIELPERTVKKYIEKEAERFDTLKKRTCYPAHTGSIPVNTQSLSLPNQRKNRLYIPEMGGGVLVGFDFRKHLFFIEKNIVRDERTSNV
jgi:hypothetical protein